MAELTLDIARKILDAALAKGVEKKLKPLVITILDARGCVKVTAAQDGTSLMRAEIAHGKAYGALAMGMGSRALFQRAQEQAYFVSAVNTMAQGRLVPVPGGVLIQGDGGLLGAVGVSGDTSDNDEICAVAGIEAAGLLNYVEPAAELDAKVDWLVSRIVDKSPTAIRRGKYAMRAIASMSFDESIAYTESQIALLAMTEDAKEGLKAFGEKRKPSWPGK